MGLYGALEAGGTKMVCAVGDEHGTILERISIPTRTPSETMPQLIEYFQKYELRALGIGCFGPIGLNKGAADYGYITTTPKRSWQNYPLVQHFSDALGIPIGFDTDVNASALGEATWGCTADVQNSIYITVGTGVGVGVILNGKPLHGMLHPEGGHIFLNRHPSDPMQRGICPFHENCLEGLACGPAVEARWGKKAVELADKPEVWELEAYYIAQALCSYILILSPQRIVLGGGIMHQEQLLPLIHREVTRQLNGYLHTDELAAIERYIVPYSLHDDQGIMGCLKLAMNAEEGA